MSDTENFGTTTFLRLTGLTGNAMRYLEAAGTINPQKSDRGWRLFSQSDVDAVKAWRKAKAQRKERTA